MTARVGSIGERPGQWIRQPSVWLLAPAGAAWTVLLLQAAIADGAPPHPHAAGVAPFAGPAPIAWAIMFAAMMLPLQVPQLSHVVLRSFASRRARAALEFLAGYALVWLAAMLAMAALPSLRPAATASPAAVSAAALLLAAAWQDMPWKRKALRACHRAPSLSAFGRRADRDCLAFGLASGGVCLVSCGPMMMALALGGHGLVAMATVSMIVAAERLERRPQIRASQLLLLLLAGVALLEG